MRERGRSAARSLGRSTPPDFIASPLHCLVMGEPSTPKDHCARANPTALPAGRQPRADATLNGDARLDSIPSRPTFALDKAPPGAPISVMRPHHCRSHRGRQGRCTLKTAPRCRDRATSVTGLGDRPFSIARRESQSGIAVAAHQGTLDSTAGQPLASPARCTTTDDAAPT